MIIFDGNKEAEQIDIKVKDYLENKIISGKLVILLLNNDPASIKYVELKEKYAKRFNIPIQVYSPNNLDDIGAVLESCKDLILDKSTKSVIVQLPVKEDRFHSIIDLIPVEKDIDLLSNVSRDIYYAGDFSRLSPVVRSFQHFISCLPINLSVKNVLVVGNGELVGSPIHFWLKNKGYNTCVTEDYASENKRKYQMIVYSTGIPYLGKGEDLSDNCCVVDFGSSRLSNKTVGDFDSSSTTSHLGVVSLSPGGMGPLVIRYLFLNHLGL